MDNFDLVQGLRNQDPAAVQHLHECYLPSVWRFVYVRVNADSHLAEDIVSETVLALIRAAATDSEIKNPLAWLRSVANHKVQDHFRAAARVQHLVEQVRQTTDDSDSNDAAQQQQLLERRSDVREVMDQLSDQQRLALEWKYIERLSVRQIAERLQTTEKAAESILFRARREFRDRINGKDRQEEHQVDLGFTAAPAHPNPNPGKRDTRLSNTRPDTDTPPADSDNPPRQTEHDRHPQNAQAVHKQ